MTKAKKKDSLAWREELVEAAKKWRAAIEACDFTRVDEVYAPALIAAVDGYQKAINEEVEADAIESAEAAWQRGVERMRSLVLAEFHHPRGVTPQVVASFRVPYEPVPKDPSAWLEELVRAVKSWRSVVVQSDYDLEVLHPTLRAIADAVDGYQAAKKEIEAES